MKRLTSLLLVLAAAAGIMWWQRASVAPYLATTLPFTRPYLAKLPGVAEHLDARKADAGEESGGGRRRGGGGGPVPVVLAMAETKNLPVVVEAVGTVQSMASIPIRPRIDNAQIASINVKEGARIEKDTVLFTLDDRTIQAERAQAEAAILKDKAQIEQAKSDLERATDLLSRRAGSAVAKQTADTAVKVAQAQLAADQASLDAIDTTLSYTTIRTPVAGRVGSIPFSVGSIVRMSDSTPLATVNQFDPIYVSFALTQSDLGALREAMSAGPVRVDVVSGRKIVSGTVAFIENTIDATTRTFTVKASIPNAEEVLWPGAFVAVRVYLESNGPMVVVPSAAVQIGQQGPYVFVVNDGAKAQLRQVSVSRTSGEQSLVSKGVEQGDKVVIDGQLRLVDGARVSVVTAGVGEKDVPADADAVPAVQVKG